MALAQADSSNRVLGPPRLVVIGGGTGLSTVLRGLKALTDQLTAIVTVTDDGGSSGMLRQDLGILPPGDIRNCILALADTEPLMTDLLNYRFNEGRLKGQSFGNLLIAAMHGVSGSFFEAIRNVSDVLAVTGRVLPVSLQDIKISARLQDGTVIDGESAISSRLADAGNRIVDLFMTPADAPAFSEAVRALSEADIIIIGPGSLFTSIIPNLLFPAVQEAIRQSPALKVFMCNLMTQPGETTGFTAAEHLQAVLRHVGQDKAGAFVDVCLVNNAWIEQDLIDRYRLEEAAPVLVENSHLEALGLRVLGAPLACVKAGSIRHDDKLVTDTIRALWQQWGGERLER